jgi:hypothetical protein
MAQRCTCCGRTQKKHYLPDGTYRACVMFELRPQCTCSYPSPGAMALAPIDPNTFAPVVSKIIDENCPVHGKKV